MAPDATEQKRVNDAVDTLFRYNKAPFIADFLKRQSRPQIPAGRYEKDELCDLVKKILLGVSTGKKKKYVLRLDDLINYLDLLQETGRQHVYLFRLPEERGDQLLARLQDLNDVKTLLGVEEELYDGRRLVWETKVGSPQLALVRYDPADGPTGPRRLVLK